MIGAVGSTANLPPGVVVIQEAEIRKAMVKSFYRGFGLGSILATIISAGVSFLI